MILISYDISDDKLRSKFSKFIEQYGYRIQYSVYRIKSSKRVMDNVILEIELRFENKFAKTDSVYIFTLCESCEKKIKKYGYAVYEDEEIINMDKWVHIEN